MHDVGQEAKARKGAQRGGEGERAVTAAVQQPSPATILPTGAVQPERPGTRNVRRLLSHGMSLLLLSFVSVGIVQRLLAHVVSWCGR